MLLVHAAKPFIRQVILSLTIADLDYAIPKAPHQRDIIEVLRMAMKNKVRFVLKEQDLIQLFYIIIKLKAPIKLHPQMMVYGIPRKQYPVFLEKQQDSARCMPRQVIYFKSLAPKVNDVAAFYRFELGKRAIAFPAELYSLRTSYEGLRQGQILGIHIRLIEVNVSKDMIRMTMSINNDNRLVCYASDHLMKVIEPIHCIYNADFLVSDNDVSGGMMSFIHQIQIWL